jgi:hypothetical protein
MNSTRILAIAFLFAAGPLSGCANREEQARVQALQAEVDRLKQDNARLLGERDEARAELEKLRGGGTGAASTAPGTTGTAGPAAAFTDIDSSAARDEILDLARLNVFEGASGAFEPARPITRAEFVRWLVRANNAMRKEKEIRLAEGSTATFPDVPPSHPDFRYIEGVANSGIAIGYDDVTFKPDKPLTREELIGIKCGLDQGGVQYKNQKHSDVDIVWHWSDFQKVNKRFLDAIYSEHFNDAKNVDRTFGAIKMFRPQQSVTRGEAAICIWQIGDGNSKKTAAEALSPAPP